MAAGNLEDRNSLLYANLLHIPPNISKASGFYDFSFIIEKLFKERNAQLFQWMILCYLGNVKEQQKMLIVEAISTTEQRDME